MVIHIGGGGRKKREHDLRFDRYCCVVFTAFGFLCVLFGSALTRPIVSARVVAPPRAAPTFLRMTTWNMCGTIFAVLKGLKQLYRFCRKTLSFFPFGHSRAGDDAV